MFLFYVNGDYLDFWSNNKGDIFVDNTIKALQLNSLTTKVIWYQNLNKPRYFNLNQDNSIDILEQIITYETVVNEETQEETQQEIISYNTLSTIEGVLYYENGNMLLPC